MKNFRVAGHAFIRTRDRAPGVKTNKIGATFVAKEKPPKRGLPLPIFERKILERGKHRLFLLKYSA